MDCPACKQPLIVVERSGIEVDWCPACKGIWFDSGELELLAEMAGREFVMPPTDPADGPGDEGAPARRCPRCPAKMGQRTVLCDPPLQIDLCPRGHGIWLDQGELGAFVSAMPHAYCTAQGQALAGFLGEVFRDSHGQPPPGDAGAGASATPPAGGA
jgi:Zn-finger nucleic acid-binding protein